MGARLLLGVTHALTARVLLRGQLSALREAGFEVGLVVGSGPDLGEVESREGVTIFRIPMARRLSPLTDLQGLAAMGRVVRQFQPDIVSAGTPKAGLLGMLAAVGRRIPVRVYMMRGLPLETSRGAMKWVLGTSERVASGCAHKVVCVSESLRRRVVELGAVRPEKIVVLGPGSGNGVDEKRFRSVDRQEQQEARQNFAIPPDVPVIGFVGRLTRDKGIIDLAEVFFESILPRFPNSRLLLAGDFEHGNPVPAEVRHRLREHPNVHAIGFTEKPEQAYSAMDVLAFPSYREGFPNAPLEAAASTVAVAGYAATGTVDAVVNGSTGTLVEVGDRMALAVALIRYLEDRKLCVRHGRLGRERAVREFRRELVWERWVEFYRELLLERRVGPGDQFGPGVV